MDLLADFLHFGASVFLLHVGLEQCEVWGVKSAVWSVKCEGSSGKWVWVWSVKCGVWSFSLECEERSVKCEVWGLECEGSSEKWEVWSVKCGVWSVECEVSVWSAKSAVWSVKCEVWGLECEGSSEKWEVWSVKCGVWSLKFGVRRVQCEVWSVECEDFASSLAEKIKRLSREGHGRDRVSLNYRSFMFGKLPPPACPGLWGDYLNYRWKKIQLGGYKVKRPAPIYAGVRRYKVLSAQDLTGDGGW